MSDNLYSVLKLIADFVWILGIVIILVAFSYIEFIAYFQEMKRKEIFKKRSVKKCFLFGLIIILIGVCTSLLFRTL